MTCQWPCLIRSTTLVRSLSAAASPPTSVWNLGKLNHVAIAVPNLEAATSLYRDMLGASVSAPQVMKLQNTWALERDQRDYSVILVYVLCPLQC